jgi:hypothetical protein
VFEDVTVMFEYGDGIGSDIENYKEIGQKAVKLTGERAENLELYVDRYAMLKKYPDMKRFVRLTGRGETEVFAMELDIIPSSVRATCNHYLLTHLSFFTKDLDYLYRTLKSVYKGEKLEDLL